MPVPNFQSFLLPVLQFAADGGEKSLRDLYPYVASTLELDDDAQQELVPSRQQRTFHNRAGWAKTYLVKAGLLEQAGRAKFRITKRGQGVLAERPAHLTKNDLLRYPEFVEFAQASTPAESAAPVTTGASDGTPDESLEAITLSLRSSLAQEVLTLVRGCSAAFFEQVVVDVLVAMGYGGSVKDAGRAIGRSGDGGIDGIIKQDRLGLENVYLQAKRWSGNVGSPEVRNFAGSLQYHKANRGVLITTSDFSRDAIETAKHLGGIVLINGEELAQLMIDYNVGVTTAVVYEIKRIDKDYFDEE
ncbi:restriction endonuclease [Deinococcus pimensis]|uniref:restriction endonuclease n=1 Tax=Deinococcus pimensis TaxID=309888 RepID=UPI0004815009|nr:restriction endonuclease [Deinococcus pimensis]